jgi:RNA polymerase sigma-54 factor
MSLPPEVIGRIVLARFLSLSLKRHENEINKVESSGIFRALFPEIITFKMFPRAEVAGDEEGFTQNTLGRIEEDGETFCIRYRFIGLAGEYRLEREKLTRLTGSGSPADFRKDEIDLFDRQLRLVSTRNRITHMILLGIIEHQPAFLKTCDPLELVPLSQMRISHWIKDQGYQSIDNSMISRVVNGTFIIMPDGKPVLLNDFFPSSREICKGHIKGILAEEEMELKSNRLDRPYTDEEIKVRLKEVYGLNISRRTVSYCRNQMGIPPFHRRNYDNRYPLTWAQFSPYFPMTSSSVKENVPEMSGIYELSLENADIEYLLKPTGVFYIGSSKNIRKRLRAHLGCWSRNGDLDAFISGGRCFLQVCCL